MAKQKDVALDGAFMEECFGDGFFDLPEDVRFDMALKRLLGQEVQKVTKNDARRYNQDQDLHNRA
jgi:hypothetical protein